MKLAARALLVLPLACSAFGANACAPRARALQATEASAAVPQAHTAHSAPVSRAWAEALERPGLPNLHRVSPLLYRGAQPTGDGFHELARLGVKSVISLRAFHADQIPIDAGLKYERISFKSWHPEDEDVVRFLRLASDPARQPVFVHCQWGSDRTGMMSAIARIVFEGWTKEEAIAEMTQGDFGFHPLWKNLVQYLRDVDLERLARKSGIRK
ncbi:MAG: tyrosine-protein phosphatase [Planctomycetes bacterium]|nr:tyrosine-protein phosphatase [Planctomycetota bacterium]